MAGGALYPYEVFEALIWRALEEEDISSNYYSAEAYSGRLDRRSWRLRDRWLLPPLIERVRWA